MARSRRRARPRLGRPAPPPAEPVASAGRPRPRPRARYPPRRRPPGRRRPRRPAAPARRPYRRRAARRRALRSSCPGATFPRHRQAAAARLPRRRGRSPDKRGPASWRVLYSPRTDSEMAGTGAAVQQKDLLAIADLDGAALRRLLALAATLKQDLAAGRSHRLLPDRVLALVFQKPSLRTRVSFEVAMLQLGGFALYLSPAEVGLGERESQADVARVLSRYVHGVVARTFLHEDVVTLARYADVPLINGLSDLAHPCQCLADLLTTEERLGRLDGVVAAYVGDGNNVTNSLIEAA